MQQSIVIQFTCFVYRSITETIKYKEFIDDNKLSNFAFIEETKRQSHEKQPVNNNKLFFEHPYPF